MGLSDVSHHGHASASVTAEIQMSLLPRATAAGPCHPAVTPFGRKGFLLEEA